MTVSGVTIGEERLNIKHTNLVLKIYPPHLQTQDFIYFQGDDGI